MARRESTDPFVRQMQKQFLAAGARLQPQKMLVGEELVDAVPELRDGVSYFYGDEFAERDLGDVHEYAVFYRYHHHEAQLHGGLLLTLILGEDDYHWGHCGPMFDRALLNPAKVRCDASNPRRHCLVGLPAELDVHLCILALELPPREAVHGLLW